jgi:hypothetical protein
MTSCTKDIPEGRDYGSKGHMKDQGKAEGYRG